jgi:uroporphyrinogen decarboxylase
VRTLDDVARLGAADPRDSVPFVFETIRLLRRELAGKVPLIGFAAAPFTLAAYLVEGRGSRQFEHTRALVLGNQPAARLLLEKVAATTADYVAAQVEAGAQAIQLFDTWAGLLGLAEYRELGLPFVQRVFDRLRGTDVPKIYFALDAAHLLPAIRDCGATVVGLDWRLPLSAASAQLGHRFALQGNLDPCALLAGPDVVERHARRVLAEGAGLPGHVFNLGHGILPTTPLESVETLVQVVHEAALPGPART